MDERQRPVRVGMSSEAAAAMTPLAMPLLLPEDELASDAPREVNALLSSFVAQCVGKTDVMASLRERYLAISREAEEPFVLPLFQHVMDDITRPLLEAKRCYVLGMPVSCIAQSGVVGEMVALWRFEMLEPTIAGRELSDEVQKLLLGRTFDKLGQDRRVQVLRAVEHLDDAMIESFGQLRGIRRKYLHFRLEDEKHVDADARRAYGHACTLVSGTLGLTVDADGQSFLPHLVHAWLLKLPEMFRQEGDDHPADGSRFR
jgi:hypothetical protein